MSDSYSLEVAYVLVNNVDPFINMLISVRGFKSELVSAAHQLDLSVVLEEYGFIGYTIIRQLSKI